MEILTLLQELGFEWPSPAYIVGAIVFGLIGLVVWRVGRRHQHATTTWLGVALMFYPYVVSSTWLLYAVGIALCAGVATQRASWGRD